MLRSVMLKSLWDQRRSLLWWSLGILAMVLLLVLIYPSVRDVPEFQDVVDSLPEAMRNLFMGSGVVDLLSPTGYLNSRLFAFLAPALFLVYGIGQGTGGIAGEEERGTLELLLSAPISRWRVVLEKFGTLLLGTLVLSLVLFVGLWVSATAVDMDIAVNRLAQASASLALLTVTFGAVALAVGAATGRRGTAMGLTTGLAVAAYLIDALAPLVGLLDVLRPASPFKYYTSAVPLQNGLDPLHVGVLIVAALVLVAVAVLGIEKRDLRV